MRIHSDILTREDLHQALFATRGVAVYSDVMSHGSRKRARAFEVRLWVFDGGKGTANPYRPQSGEYSDVYAATYAQWGDFLAHLFFVDPNAIAGHYKGRDSFLSYTHGEFQPRGWREGVSA